jgi:RNA polymerase sigma factor (sigma-70 family)
MDLPKDRAMPGSRESLTDITTIWSQISCAHTPGPEGQVAMNDLIGRYHDAVERYLRLKLRDKHLADEVLQEFWTKLLNRKLAGADSSKGRFRDYLRTVLHRLIIDHFRTKKHQSLPPGDILDPSSPDDDYERVWRETMIRRVWTRLDTFEVNTPKNRYATVLHLRAGNPKASIDELAQKLGEQTGSIVTPEAFRKTLQRGRAKFLELLEKELRETIHPAEPQDIEAEIIDLGLGSLYRRYSSKSD